MKSITIKIEIDEKAGFSWLRRVGCKCPIAGVQSTEPEHIAGLWRDLAAYAMENAFLLEHGREFCPPAFTNAEREEMARRICEEHKNILEEERTA